LYKIVRRPPCWKSTARLARHAGLDLLDWLDKVERVESSRAKWNLSLRRADARGRVDIIYGIWRISLFCGSGIVTEVKKSRSRREYIIPTDNIMVLD